MIVLRQAFAEAISRRVLAAASVFSLGFIGLFWLAYSLAFDNLTDATTDGGEIALIAGMMTILGLYTVQFLASFLTILLASGTVASEIDSGRILSIMARPISRSSWLAQRAGTFGGMAMVYVLMMTGAVLVVAATIGGFQPLDPWRGMALLALQVAVLVALGAGLSTRLSTVATGVIVVALYGLAWLGGIVEFVASTLGNQTLERIGIAVRLVMPSDALWRGASYYLQSPTMLLAEDLGEVPFISGAPPSVAQIVWAVLYVVVCSALAVWSLRKRDL